MGLRSLFVAAALVTAVPAVPAGRRTSGGSRERRPSFSRSGRRSHMRGRRALRARCGGGQRQLGLVDAAGRLYPAAKGNTLFAGAVADLAPYCGREVEIDVW